MNPRDLLAGERLLMIARQHRVVLVRPFVFTVLAGIVLAVILALVPLTGEVRLLATLGVAALALAILNVSYWRWRAHEYVLTDQRVILNEGILNRFSRSIAVDRIQDLTSYQGLWARAWGYGDIELESAGRESAELLRRVPHPQRFRNAVFAAMEARRRSGQ